MYCGVAKHGMPMEGFPRHLLDFAFDSLKAELRTKVRPVIGTSVLSLQEAVCGRAGISGFSSINFSTSEGFPLIASRPPGAANKKYLFDLELGENGYRLKGIDEKLLNLLAIKHNLRKKGIVPFTVSTDCTKDARIPIPKTSIPGKTRIFSISPVDFTIQFRQYMLPYTVAHQQSRAQFSSAVGIDVNGAEWTDLVTRMANHSPHHACGDYSNFGAGFCAEVHGIVARGILDWFQFWGSELQTPVTEEEQLIREVLFAELTHSWHLCFDILYQVISGMPSGSPITVETNDLVNLCYILMAWHEIMTPFSLGSHYYFNKFIKIKTYGDDLWLSISPIVIENFNNITIQNFFTKYGVKYTDANKSGEMVSHKPLAEVSFLKRTPRPHPTRPGMFLAELEIGPSLDISNWCWESKDSIASTLVNIEACSDALYGHGPEVHNHYREILQREAHKLGRIGNFRSWRELDQLHLGADI